MIEALIGCGIEDDAITCEGDAETLLADTFTLIGSIYFNFLQNCPVCPHVYKEALMDKDLMEEAFKYAEEMFAEDILNRGYKDYEDFREFNFAVDEDEEEDNQSEHRFKEFKNFSTQSNDMKLFGFEEYKKRKNKE